MKIKKNMNEKNQESHRGTESAQARGHCRYYSSEV